MTTVDEVRLIELPKFFDSRGNLSFIEQCNHIPFEIRRTYWIYDVPGGECRGGHAYHDNKEFIVALSGGFDITLDDGKQKQTYSLNRSYFGLYVPNGLWREMGNFTTNSVALIISSTDYDANDYIRDYAKFLNFKNNGEI